MSRTALLLYQMNEAYQRLSDRIVGLTDEEYLWEPVTGCWTVRIDEDENGTARARTDQVDPTPEPAPVTTIAWRMAHLVNWKLLFHEWGFGVERPVWEDLHVPCTATDARRLLDLHHQLLHSDLVNLVESNLDEERVTPWGEKRSVWRLIWTMIDHDIHHGAEIGCLRDLYLRREHLA